MKICRRCKKENISDKSPLETCNTCLLEIENEVKNFHRKPSVIQYEDEKEEGEQTHKQSHVRDGQEVVDSKEEGLHDEADKEDAERTWPTGSKEPLSEDW